MEPGGTVLAPLTEEGEGKHTPGELCQRIRGVVREVEPDAEIILYGSRARGDAEPDSDWDLLILLNGPVSRERERAICDRLYDVELALDEVLCPLVYSRQEWESPVYRAMPLHDHVHRDGIAL